MKVVVGLGLALAAVTAAAQPADELGGREVGTAVLVRGTVDSSYRGDSRPLETGRAVRLYWRLTSHEESELMMAFVPDRGVLLLGPESDLYVEEHHVPEDERSLETCRTVLTCETSCRMGLTRGHREICKLTVRTPDAVLEALGTDFALVAHPLYGTLVEVFEGALEVKVGDEVIHLSAGGLILVRGGRTWLGLAAAEEAAPVRTFDATPFPDPPALTPEQVFPRDSDVGLPE
jgi:hypothetical protein